MNYFTINRHNKTAALLHGFTFWEQVQTAFRIGLQMPDGDLATGIGRCKNAEDFAQRARAGSWRVLTACKTCQTPMDPLDAFPGQICLKCHEVRFNAEVRRNGGRLPRPDFAKVLNIGGAK